VYYCMYRYLLTLTVTVSRNGGDGCESKAERKEGWMDEWMDRWGCGRGGCIGRGWLMMRVVGTELGESARRRAVI
jgi:hypothetical protein